MQLKDLVKPITEMSDEELLERLRQVRHSRSVERPAARKIIEKVEKKGSRTRVSTTEKLLLGLSEEDRLELIKQLEGANGASNEGDSTNTGNTEVD